MQPPKKPVSTATVILIAVVAVVVVVVAGIFVIATFTPMGPIQTSHANQTNVSNFIFHLQNGSSRFTSNDAAAAAVGRLCFSP
jgi:hypothetical protein